jgi:hypothetical protein
LSTFHKNNYYRFHTQLQIRLENGKEVRTFALHADSHANKRASICNDDKSNQNNAEICFDGDDMNFWEAYTNSFN